MPPLTISNARDKSRIFPSSSFSQANLTQEEGVILEKITGPLASATVELAYPALEITHIQAYVTATGAWHTTPNLKEGVDYSVVKKNANGVAALTELLAASQAARTWLVWYRQNQPDATPGNQSVALPGDGI
jgi:hypothetical protein